MQPPKPLEPFEPLEPSSRFHFWLFASPFYHLHSGLIEISQLKNFKYLQKEVSETNAFIFYLSDDCKISINLKNIWERVFKKR